MLLLYRLNNKSFLSKFFITFFLFLSCSCFVSSHSSLHATNLQNQTINKKDLDRLNGLTERSYKLKNLEKQYCQSLEEIMKVLGLIVGQYNIKEKFEPSDSINKKNFNENIGQFENQIKTLEASMDPNSIFMNCLRYMIPGIVFGAVSGIAVMHFIGKRNKKKIKNEQEQQNKNEIINNEGNKAIQVH